MKIKAILSLLILTATSVKAQPWNPGAPTGSIYYSSGNVGIGTNAPDMSLSVWSNDQFITRFHSTGAQSITGLRIGRSPSYADLVNLPNGFGIGAGTASSNLPLDSQNPNHVYFFLSTGGNLGVGTTTPGYKTVISNNGASGLEIDPTGSQFSEGIGMQAYNRSTSAFLPFQIYSSKLILGGGNVGVGTSNPLYKIVVSHNNGVGIEIDPTGTQLTGGVGIQAYNRATSSYTPLQIYGSKLILDGGNVLIGKTIQQNLTYKLDVNGSIRSNEIVVNTDGADFVFEQDYKLKDLAEVEKFIRDNKHLPDIESAREMAEKGLELGKMDMKLLQKIEELTLYMIELKKEISVLKEENQKLNAKMASSKGN